MLYLCYPSPNIELLHCRGRSVKFGQNVEGRVNLSFSFTGHLGTVDVPIHLDNFYTSYNC